MKHSNATLDAILDDTLDHTLAGPGRQEESEIPIGEAPAAAITGAQACDDDSTVELGHSLQIKDVEAVHRRLIAALDAGTRVTVDLSRLGSADTAGVQLLLSFQGDARKRGVEFEFIGTSDALNQALVVLGLLGTFEASSP